MIAPRPLRIVPSASRLNGAPRQRRSVRLTCLRPHPGTSRRPRGHVLRTRTRTSRRRAEEPHRRAGQVRLRVRRRGETPPDVVIQVGPTGLPAHLDPSRRRCSPHAPTSPRPLATSRNSSSCAAPLPARKETRTTAPLRPGTDRGSGPITALPTGFWCSLPKASTGFGDAAPARESTSRSQLVTASRNTTPATAPSPTPHDDPLAGALFLQSWRSPPTVRRLSVPQAIGPPSANRKVTLERSLRLPLGRASTACSCACSCDVGAAIRAEIE
jgi:hypothetical protein